MAKAIHMMVRVLDLEKSIAFYQTAFGLDVADRFDFDGIDGRDVLRWDDLPVTEEAR